MAPGATRGPALRPADEGAAAVGPAGRIAPTLGLRPWVPETTAETRLPMAVTP